MKSILSYSIALILLFSSCLVNPEEDVTTGEIVGSVSDKTTGEPIATANVVLLPGGNSTVTGTDGSFYYKDIEVGKYIIELNKDGFLKRSSTVSINSGQITILGIDLVKEDNVISFNFETLDFDTNTSLKPFSFTNCSYEDLEWNVVENSDWIVKVEPQEGVLPYGKIGTIVVVIDREKLEEGENLTYLYLTANNIDFEIKVKAFANKKPHKPKLEIYDATEIDCKTAKLTAKIIDPGFPEYYERGFVYDTLLNPTIYNYYGISKISKDTSLYYRTYIKDLLINTTYYVRAYAINENGVVYSPNHNKFLTSRGELPILKIKEVTNVRGYSATLNSYFLSFGKPKYYERGFVYSITENPTLENCIGYRAFSEDSNYDFSCYIDDLEINTKYYVRSYAKNELGITYSENISFTTTPQLPIVKTLYPTDVDVFQGVATISGSIEYLGEPEYNECGFVYSTTHIPTIEHEKILINNTFDKEFFSTIKFPPNIVYVRAYAINEAGVAYGECWKINMCPYISRSKYMILKKDLGKYTWDEALKVVNNLDIGGYSDWRLPDIWEIAAMRYDKDYIGEFKDEPYWYDWGDYPYCYMDFGVDVDDSGLGRGTGNELYNVRPVRTITK